MSIRYKTVLFLVLTFLGLLGILCGSAYLVITHSFIRLENQTMEGTLRRTVATVNEDIAEVDKTLGDWAPWDESYNFATGHNPAYIHDNLDNATLINLRVNFLVFVRPDGTVYYAKCVDFGTKASMPLPHNLQMWLAQHASIMPSSSTNGHLSGIMMLPEGPLLFSMQPILHNDHRGPVHAMLMMGRWLNAAEITRLSNLLHSPLHISRVPDTWVKQRAKTPRTTTVISRKGNVLHGFRLMTDVQEQPAILLHVTAPRNIYAQGMLLFKAFLLVLIILVLICCGLAVWQLERIILRRLTAMHSEVQRIEASNDFSERITTHSAQRQDELETLAMAVNAMLSTLEQAHHDKVAQQAIRKSEERYRHLVELCPLAVFILNEDILIYANTAGKDLLYIGDTLPDADTSIFRWIPNNEHAHIAAFLQQAQNSLVAVRHEQRLVQSDGHQITVEMIGARFVFADKECTQVIAQDITKRKETEQAIHAYQASLRALATELTVAEEAERHRIASDLHDYIGQTLVISRIMLGTLRDSLQNTDQLAQVDEVRSLLEEGIEWTRSMTTDLSLPILKERGVMAAVEWLVEVCRNRHGLTVNLTTNGHEPDMGTEMRNLCFRTIKELLINVVKHAQTTHAWVNLRWTEDTVAIDIRDDGIGMVGTEADIPNDTRHGFGLFSIRERVFYLGGRFVLTSQPGEGVHVSMVVPLSSVREGEAVC